MMKYLFALMMIVLVSTAGFAAEKSKPLKGKVALLFLTVGDIQHPELWKQLLSGNRDKFTIYVHSKAPLQDRFFQKYRLAHPVHTSWANHVQAWKVLLKEAIKDPENKKFIYLSESCAPLHPLEDIYKVIMSHNKSYMNYWKSWWTPETGRAITELHEENRYINSEWVILNREHAQMVAEDYAIIRICDSHPHSAESHPSCLFSFYNSLLNGSVINYISTYVNFELGHDSHPYTFVEPTEANITMLKEAQKGGIFFARKFSKEFPDQVLKDIIYQTNKEESGGKTSTQLDIP